MITVKRLVLTVRHEQRLLQCGQQVHLLDIGTGIMNEYTGFHIPIGIDMTVVSAACDTAAHIFTIVLEVKGEDGLTALHGTDLTDAVIHILSLIRIRKQFTGCLISYRHIMEVPAESGTLFNDHIQEFITGDYLIVFAGVADRSTEDQTVLLHQIHGMHDLIKHALATAQIVYFIEAFQADSYGEIAYTLHILAEFFIDQGAVGKCMEATVIMLLT